MTFLTIFSAPKPFTDPHINIIQRNAIESWLQLGTDVEVVLAGEEEGLSEVAEEYNVFHQNKIERNKFGTPRVDSIFNQARKLTNSKLLAYINTDIILTSDFVRVAREINNFEDHFLIVGRRWDLQINEPICFRGDWLNKLEEKLKEQGTLHGPTALDYFIFPRGSYMDIPAFAIGRAGWDNWMIYQAIKSGMMVIDGTFSITAIHQKHDYSHLPGGMSHHQLKESNQNVEIGGGFSKMYDLLDVDWYFINDRKKAASLNFTRFLRKIERVIMPKEKKGLRWLLTQKIRRIRKQAVIRHTKNLQNKIIEFKFTK